MHMEEYQMTSQWSLARRLLLIVSSDYQYSNHIDIDSQEPQLMAPCYVSEKYLSVGGIGNIEYGQVGT